MRTIKVCSGIGDNIWLLMKLINAGEQFHFQLPAAKPQRGKQIFDLIPEVSVSCEYVQGMKHRQTLEQNAQRYSNLWGTITAKEFFLSCNTHLEVGKRLERFLPDLPISFRIPWTTKNYALNVQTNFPPRSKYIGLYGSSYSTSRAWGFWDEHKWLELAKMIYRHDPSYVFVIIGAEWDLDLGRNLVQLLYDAGIPFINTIGEPLGAVIEIMKRLTYFFSFPSGLGILAPTVSCPVTMFYPKHLKPMINAWASEEDIGTGLYKGCLFCEPDAIFKWVVENGKI